ncbi:MAG: glycosyltransferase family 4 protein [Patescibacteria group bacterium]
MQKTTKILYLLTTDDWGGAQQYVADLAVHFHRQGCAISVAFGQVDSKHKLIDILKQHQINYLIIPHLRRDINPIKDLLALWEIFKLIRQNDFDIVHANSSKAGFTGRLAAWVAGVEKIFYTAHGWVFNEQIHPLQKIFFQFLEKIAALFSTRIFCLSPSEYQLAISKNIIPAAKLSIVSLGVDLDDIKKDSQTPNQFSHSLAAWREHYQIIGTVGNFYPTKNTTLLIKIAHELINIEHQPYRLVIIGDGGERPRIESLINQYQLQKHILLTGQINHPASLMRYFDLFVLPSTKEGLPYTILEAGALGLPVVASHVGGIGSIIDNGQNGLLIDNINVKSFVTAINQILSHKNRAKWLGQNLRQRVKTQFNRQSMWARYEQEYNFN